MRGRPPSYGPTTRRTPSGQVSTGLTISEGYPLTDHEREQTIRTLKAQIAAHESWAQTTDRTGRTANARKAFEAKFLRDADGDPQRAEHLRKAYYARLALQSAKARKRRGGAA